VNTSLYDYCPEVVEAFVKRGDELIGHGHTNSERQGEMSEAAERALLQYCHERMFKESGVRVQGWLSPWISESFVTPDLLHETGYTYTLNWCHDDQPVELKTRNGRIWSVPYPQEVNDVPAIIARQMDARDFADLIVDNFDEMLEQSRAQPLVMGIALHPYIVGQPYRLRHLRRALQHIVKEKRVWLTTPAAIVKWVGEMPGNGTSLFT
jgi:peptidoglycan/xylan/chitin deacetylase (PgdA/CDA1 family)